MTLRPLPDRLIAVIPHLLGFKPEESLVFLPMSSELPAARVDLPATPDDREVVWNSIRDAYGRHAQPGTSLAIVCITADRETATDVGHEVRGTVQLDRHRHPRGAMGRRDPMGRPRHRRHGFQTEDAQNGSPPPPS